MWQSISSVICFYNINNLKGHFKEASVLYSSDWQSTQAWIYIVFFLHLYSTVGQGVNHYFCPDHWYSWIQSVTDWKISFLPHTFSVSMPWARHVLKHIQKVSGEFKRQKCTCAFRCEWKVPFCHILWPQTVYNLCYELENKVQLAIEETTKFPFKCLNTSKTGNSNCFCNQ